MVLSHGVELSNVHSETACAGEAWEFLLREREGDDGYSLEELRADCSWIDGSEEYGPNAHLSVDDAGSIETIELTEIP